MRARVGPISVGMSAVAVLALFLHGAGRDGAPPMRPETPDAILARRVSIRLAGVVLSAPDDRPLAGAMVRATCGRSVAETSTGVDGRFRLTAELGSNVPTILRIEARGYLSREAEVWVSGELYAALHPIAKWVMGRVVDAADRPVPGARVRVGGERPLFADTGGRFGPFPVGLAPAKWCASADGFAAVGGTFDPDAAELLVVMPPAVCATGIVVNARGVPVPGAYVRNEWMQGDFTVRTGLDGMFSFPLPPAGRAFLTAHRRIHSGIADACAGDSVRIVLDKLWLRRSLDRYRGSFPPPPEMGRLPVRVVDAEARPVAGARVRLRGWLLSDDIDLPLPEARSGPDGSCEFRVPLVTYLWVLADRAGEEGRVSCLTPSRPSSEPVSTVEVALSPVVPPGPQFRVRVLDAEGRPVPAARVVPGEGEMASTDARGDARVPSRAGEISRRLLVVVPGYPGLHVDAVAGGEPVVVRLAPNGAIRVRLRTRGTWDCFMQARARLEGGDARSPGAGEVYSPCVHDDGDSARIRLPEGVYTVVFKSGACAWVSWQGVRVTAGEEALLRYEPPSQGEVAVRVVDADGAPVHRARVFAADTGTRLGETDEDGRFVWGQWLDSPPRIARLLVGSMYHAPVLTAPVDARMKMSITVVLARGEPVRGRLTDGEGRPVVRAALYWRRDDGPPVEAGDTKEDGSFLTELAFPPGSVRLLLETRDGWRGEFTVKPGETDFRVDLR